MVFYQEDYFITHAHRLIGNEVVEVPLAEPVLRTKIWRIPGPTTKPKKRRTQDVEWHWMSTPSWWTRLTMNRPQRRAGRLWERKVLFQDLEDADPPGVSHKPHIYFW